MPVKSRGGKRLRKRPAVAGQVCDEKTNMDEPLRTHRNVERWRRNRRLWVSLGQRPAHGRALSQGAGCVLPWWRPVYRWRELVAGRWHGTGEPVASIPTTGRYRRGLPVRVARGRTPSGRNRKGQSTDARHRGGPARSSGEGPVMGLERRGWAGQIDLRSPREGRS